MYVNRFILGHIHQGTLGSMGLSRSFGTQCTAIALVALCFATLHTPPHLWSSDNLDTIVFEGDGLYHRIVDTVYNGDTSVMLAHDDIPSVTCIFDSEYRIEVHFTVYGISERNRVANDDVVTLGNGLTNAFSRSNSVVTTFGSSSVAVFRQRNTYYIFDSHSRNGFGEVDPEGACVLLQFSSRDALCNYLFHMYEGHFF